MCSPTRCLSTAGTLDRAREMKNTSMAKVAADIAADTSIALDVICTNPKLMNDRKPGVRLINSRFKILNLST